MSVPFRKFAPILGEAAALARRNQVATQIVERRGMLGGVKLRAVETVKASDVLLISDVTFAGVPDTTLDAIHDIRFDAGLCRALVTALRAVTHTPDGTPLDVVTASAGLHILATSVAGADLSLSERDTDLLLPRTSR